MPRVSSVAIRPGSTLAGPLGPRRRMCPSAASRSSALARAAVRYAAASLIQATTVRSAITALSPKSTGKDVDKSARPCATSTIAVASSRAVMMTSTAITTPRTTVRMTKPRVLRA